MYLLQFGNILEYKEKPYSQHSFLAQYPLFKLRARKCTLVPGRHARWQYGRYWGKYIFYNFFKEERKLKIVL